MAEITIPGMFLTGIHASRPAASAVGSGSIYSCSTHSLLYQSDGASWTTWATLGGGLHASTHENGGADEIDVTGLTGAGGGSGAAVGCIIYNNATQSFSANAKAAFNAEDSDPDGFHDNSTNNSRATVPTGLGGIYFCKVNLYQGTSNTPEMHLIVNNTTKVRGSYTATAWGGGPSAVVALAQGDYIECQTPSSSATLGHATDREKMNTMYLYRFGT